MSYRSVVIGSVFVMIFAIVWGTGLFHASPTQDGSTAGQNIDGVAPTSSSAPIGDKLYTAKPGPTTKPHASHMTLSSDPVVLGDFRLVVVEKADVPSEKDGVILFIGTDIKPGEQVPPDRLIEVEVGKEKKKYRKLEEGDVVENGQLLAELDDKLARDDLAIANSKVVAAQAEHQAAVKIYLESEKQYITLKELRGSDGRAASKREVDLAKASSDRYSAEADSKKQAIEVARLEAEKTQTSLEKYQIRSPMRGVIQTIYKQRGEAVKSQPTFELVFQIRNLNRLRAEGMMDVQHIHTLQKSRKVVIESAPSQGPERTLIGHMQEVTGVAVARDGKIVSCSLDNTARIWDPDSRESLRILQHPVPVRAVACTPKDASANLCMTGAANGSARLWDLDLALQDESGRPIQQANHDLGVPHKGAINCVAISPDGSVCATGGDDRTICVWEIANDKLLYRLTGHSGAITSIQFTPQSQLVSAARDNTVRLWDLGTEGGRLVKTIPRRSGDVTQLGVSPDGTQVIFDPWQSKELRLLSLAEERTKGILKYPSGASQFTTLALFSPDARLILTEGGSEGLLQLWNTPAGGTRARMLRNLVPPDRAPATCAAFAPDGSFLVTGSRDRHVVIWKPLPSVEEVARPLVANVSNIEESLDAASAQMRITAVLELPERTGTGISQDSITQQLFPGSTVTVVCYPQEGNSKK